MSPPRYHLDSNILIRFFTGEPEAMFKGASALIDSAERGDVVLDLSPLVLAETAFTLESFYKRPRADVAGKLLEFIKRLGVRLAEKDRLLDALERVRGTGVHLVDAYLAAIAAETKLPIASFDRDLDRFKDVKRFEPKG
jgi:predicted nucleic acid-binding protein